MADATRSAVLALVQSTSNAIAAEPLLAERFRTGIAYYDTERDEVITERSEFADAVAALQADPAVIAVFGTDNAHRLAIQFVYNTWRHVNDAADLSAVFDSVWQALIAEVSTPDWRFAAVANLNNFSYDGDTADLGYGVSIQGRSFERLKQTLQLDQWDLERLSQDWMAGGGPSSHVLVVITTQPKSPDNFILATDGASYVPAAQALLAMRLVGPGDVHLGKMFLGRPANFDVGIGGGASTGWTIWRPGSQYVLTEAMVPEIRAQVDTLTRIASQVQASARHIGVALRAFSSSYDRLFHQGEDSIVDAITALEALWKVGSELSFRLAFRTASLLGRTDDEREQIFETVRTYYTIRNHIVHGSTLDAAQRALVSNEEPLRVIVRMILRAFIHLLANPGEWTVGRLAKDPDPTLLHSVRRPSLQKAMGVLPANVAPQAP